MILWIALLYALGVALIMTEFFVPGLVLGTIGAVCLLASGVMAVMQAPDYAIFIIAFELIGLAVAVVCGMYLMPRTRAGKALILQGSDQLAQDWVAVETDDALVGKTGEAFTKLRPAGTILVDGRRIDAVTGGDFIEQGEAVRVLEVHGSRVVVERARN